ncbi:hypothetical protein KI387_003547, partial [Taxus chinensis]
LVGTTTAMLCNLLKRNGGHTGMWMSFCVLQLRLPSGRPQGILNLGAIILEEDSQLHGLSSFHGGDLGRAQPRAISFVGNLFFKRHKVKNTDDDDYDDDNEQGILYIPWKNSRGCL